MLNKLRHIIILLVLSLGVLSNNFANSFGHDASKISVEKGAEGRYIIKAWEALAKSNLDDAFRRNVDYLDNISKHSTNTGKSGDEIAQLAKSNENGPKQFFDELEDTPASGTYASDPDGIWNLNPIARGRAAEIAQGQNLHANFPFIDKFDDASRVATSIKSTDTYAKTYTLADNLEGIWKKYVDDLAAMPSSVTYAQKTVDDVSKKVLEIVVPTPLDAGRNAVLQKVINHAKGKGINGGDIEINIVVLQ